jgi:hypothetical protein
MLMVVLLVSFLLGEVALRVFTPYPITTDSNTVSDENLGYRLDSDFKDVNAAGFRNVGSLPYAAAAIGDSHTYGYSVAADKAWPAQFEKRTNIATYNFGTSSYGIYAYHALLMNSVRPGVETIFVALYPGQ